MASIRKEVLTAAPIEAVWDAIRDVGALHTRLVPGFVVNTEVDGGVRTVTFGNGMVVREPIVDIDETNRRLVWSAIADGLAHYNASVQVFEDSCGETRVLWIADLLPNHAAAFVEPMMQDGMAAMKQTLDRLRA